MILGFFKIVPNYFKLNQEEYYHNLTNVEMNLPTLIINEVLRQEYYNERFDIVGLTEREVLIKHLVYEKKDLTRRSKICQLLNI